MGSISHSGRLAAREGHFFPAELLAGQYRDLEYPADDEHVPSIPVDGVPEAIVDHVLAERIHI